jgi:hypothetical protein
VPRIALGVALIVLGAFGALAAQGDVLGLVARSRRGASGASRHRAGAAALRAAGGREAASERRARIRSEERAEVAAQVHDSVLQTLTLIQRSAHDPDEVLRLARTEERALRRWLYAPVGDPSKTLVAAIESEIAEVEGRFACTVELVQRRRRAARRPCRRARGSRARGGGQRGQARRWCGLRVRRVRRRRPPRCSCATAAPGFDPDAVPTDRLGLRESVLGRMARVGGSAPRALDVGRGRRDRPADAGHEDPVVIPAPGSSVRSRSPRRLLTDESHARAVLIRSRRLP